MNKISVVIPTLQKNLIILNKLLSLLVKDKAVEEIILINNSQTKFKPMSKSKKLRIYDQKENLYVNQSWNLGIELCKNDRFLIMNDDILCCENFVTEILESGILEKDDTGLVGLNNACIKTFEVGTKDIEIPLCECELLDFNQMFNYMYTGNWGSGFLGKKENYYKIPSRIKIIYGDNYLLYKNLKNNKKNYSITGLKFNHLHSLSSSSSEFNDVVCADIRNHAQYFKE